MNALELHILQSYPYACLNRDEDGSPKTVNIGGVTRGRQSSQTLKRAARMFAIEHDGEHFGGIRQKALKAQLHAGLIEAGVSDEDADKYADIVSSTLGVDEKNKEKSNTLLYFSTGEIKAFASAIHEAIKDGSIDKYIKESVDKKTKKKNMTMKSGALKKILDTAKAADIADISFFGRFLAKEPSLTLEGAAAFSHAFTVHKVRNAPDFFSAVDESAVDENSEQGATGAGHIDETEGVSGCYYRSVVVNLDLLKDEQHLGVLDDEDKKKVLALMIRAICLAMPGGRRNSHLADTRPAYVLGVIRKGQPITYASAFEEPITSHKGYVQEAIDRLKRDHASEKDIWGCSENKVIATASIPDVGMEAFVEELLSHVWK